MWFQCTVSFKRALKQNCWEGNVHLVQPKLPTSVAAVHADIHPPSLHGCCIQHDRPAPASLCNSKVLTWRLRTKYTSEYASGRFLLTAPASLCNKIEQMEMRQEMCQGRASQVGFLHKAPASLCSRKV